MTCNATRVSPRHHPVVAAACAALALAVAIGFGRFGFTAVSPLMLHEGILNLRGMAIAQATHFMGYFVGALVVVWIPPRIVAVSCAAGLVSSVVLLAAAGFATTELGICLDRFLSGVASAVVMVTASTWLFQVAGTSWAPLLYSGVGLGITAASETVSMLIARGASDKSVWLALAFVAGAIALLPLIALRSGLTPACAADLARSSRPDISPGRLVLVYAAGGIGYVISATFLPALIASAPFHINPVDVFSFFGLCAIPSCFVWLAIDARIGTRRALAMNYGIQTFGTVLSTVSSNPVVLLTAAAAVGITFMGVVAMAMAMAGGRRHASYRASNLMAVLTAACALGQAVGPAFSALGSGPAVDLHFSLWFAAAVLGASTAITLIPYRAVDRASAEHRRSYNTRRLHSSLDAMTSGEAFAGTEAGGKEAESMPALQDQEPSSRRPRDCPAEGDHLIPIAVTLELKP